jgi:hypothetical protein
LFWQCGILELFWQCGILELLTVWYFRIVLTVWYFGIVLTVWYFRIVLTVLRWRLRRPMLFMTDLLYTYIYIDNLKRCILFYSVALIKWKANNTTLYHCNSCEFDHRSWRGVPDTTLCDKVCQWLAAGRWFSPGIPVSSTNKTDRQEAEISTYFTHIYT